MRGRNIRISGTGCALADYLFSGISFGGPQFNQFSSHIPGDGGLKPGRLVFTEELEAFAGKPFAAVYHELLGSRQPDAFNVGGPSIVSLIHAAQMLGTQNFTVEFHGMAGKDETSERIFRMLAGTPIGIDHYRRDSIKATPFTYVLSDPGYDEGHGERTFINNIGAAWDFKPEDLSDDFFKADIVCFGGTALVPNLHDHLTSLLARVKGCSGITVVNTVYDFRNEKRNPGQPWPLVEPGDWGLIDLLIMDATEALSISGCQNLQEAAEFYMGSGVGSFIITNGAQELVAWSGGGTFKRIEISRFPVSAWVTEKIRSATGMPGDTTGCGDNFAGGVIASIAWQLREGKGSGLELKETVSWGVASGGFCCFTVGGTYIEEFPGQKHEQVKKIHDLYLTQ
jgi:sugar/nucleoside kinase (ribokinase family)